MSEQGLGDLITLADQSTSQTRAELFVQKGENGAPKKIDVPDVISPFATISLSPDGHFLIVEAYVRSIPSVWKEYDDPLMQKFMKRRGPDFYYVGRLLLIDLTTQEIRPLVNAPIPSACEILWAPSGKSVVVSGTYLPLDIDGSEERKARRSHIFVAEIEVPSGVVAPVTSENMTIVGWSRKTHHLMLEQEDRRSSVETIRHSVYYERTAKGWVQVPPASADMGGSGQVVVRVEEDSNHAPKVLITDPESQQTSLLLRLGSELEGRSMGKVEDVEFKASDGRLVRAGLYYPPDYVPGRLYPLVIQTHGWDPQRFWPSGPYPTGFAAEPLAGRGMMVIQLEEDFKYLLHPEEGALETSAYEGAIDYLAGRSLINRNQVGIIGFSRTNYHVKYALTHSRYRFAAAAVAEGFDAGYFQYITYVKASPAYAESFESANGDLPFGSGLQRWIGQSPGFNLDKVKTPLRILANGRFSPFAEWEWFSGFSRLNLPVEMVYLPEAAHVLVKPWECLVSQEGNVDWFDFWLNGHEDADRKKAEQYARWRELRKLQEQNEKTPANAASSTSN